MTQTMYAHMNKKKGINDKSKVEINVNIRIHQLTQEKAAKKKKKNQSSNGTNRKCLASWLTLIPKYL
jgi:hypothetical protein